VTHTRHRGPDRKPRKSRAGAPRATRAGAPTRGLTQRYTAAEIEALCTAAERADMGVGPWIRAAAMRAAQDGAA
jgi:hypothetical protein